MSVRLERFSFRFAEQVLNSKLSLKHEIEEILTAKSIIPSELSRPRFNLVLKNAFAAKGWAGQPGVFDDPADPGAKMDFLKERLRRRGRIWTCIIHWD